MKASFKYAFLTGWKTRGIVFSIVTAMMIVFIIIGTLVSNSTTSGTAFLITAVSLGGCGIAAVAVACFISDIAISRHIFSSPGGYLYALTPIHRGKTLFASVISMMVMDFIALAVVIIGEVWLSLLLAGQNVIQNVLDFIRNDVTGQMVGYVFLGAFLVISAVLFIEMVVIFCTAASKSLFYSKPLAGVLTGALAVLCFYVYSLLQLALAPFGEVERSGMFIMVTIGGTAGAIAYAMLMLLSAAGLFALTSKLVEKKLCL